LSKPTSSFSFIAESVKVVENQDIQSNESASGFDFLSAMGDTASDVPMLEESQQYAQGTSKMSSFNFLNSQHTDFPSSGSELSNTIVTKPSAENVIALNNIDILLGPAPPEIPSVLDVKLNRMASTKEVYRACI